MIQQKFALKLFVLVSATFFFGAALCSAQVPQGQVLGTVMDASGSVVPGATVVLENEQTGIVRTAIANEEGAFAFSYLNSGIYRLKVEHQGFKTSIVNDIQVQAAEKKRVEVGLQLGEITANIVVSTESVSKLDTDSSTMGVVLSRKEVIGLPLNGREFSQLALIQPGVSFAGTVGADIQTYISTKVQVGGTSPDKNAYTLDGVDNTSDWFAGPAMSPSIDSIQEFRIDRNLASAEYGLGGAQLHLVSKSGTNGFHGAIWEFNRYYKFNAGQYYTHIRDTIIRNQFGANIGGPIIKNRLFFFFNWESQRQRATDQKNGTVFTDKMREGDLSELPTAVIDPVTGQPFPGNIIPSNRLNKYTVDLVQSLMPRATRPGIVNNYTSNVKTRRDYNQFSPRVDYNPTDKDFLVFRFSAQPRKGIGEPLDAGWLNAQEDFHFYNAGLGWTRNWNPQVTTETRFGYHSEKFNQDTVQPETQPKLKIKGFGPDPIDHLPFIIMSNFVAFGQPGNNIIFDFKDYDFTQNLTYIRGNHLIKGGFSNIKYNPKTPFAYTKTSWPFLYFLSNIYTGSDAGDLLLGLPWASFVILQHIPRSMHYSDYGLFVQDDWKITPSLTLNLGLRFDLQTQAVEENNIWGNFSPDLRKIVLAGDTISDQAPPVILNGYRNFLVTANQTQLPNRTLVNGDHNNFAPRVGFAWRPFGNNKTVLRGGYGIYYLRPRGQTTGSNQYTIPYGGNIFTLNTQPNWSFTAEDAFSGNLGQLPAPSAYYRDPNLRSSYMQQSGLSLERELPWGVVGELSLQHQKTLKLETSWDLNGAYPGSGSVQSRRPYPEFSSITGVFNEGTSRYDTMEVLARKNSQHYTFQGSYNWTKIIASGPYINIYDRRLFDGPPSSYRPHVIKLHFLADLPFGKGRRWLDRGGVTDGFLGGWTLSGIATPYASGVPFSVDWSGDSANVGVSSVRPNRVCDGKLAHPTVDKWFDTSCFVDPTPGTFGNAGTGILFGPSFFSADFGAYKSFSIRENVKLQFRTEIFNVLNHPNLGTPNTTLNGFAFGQITVVSQDPRVIQFALRLNF